MVGPTHHCYYGSSSDYDHYHYYPAAPAALPHTCLGPHRLGAHGLRPVHQSLARGSQAPLHMGQDSRYDHYRYQLAAWHLLIRCSSAWARTDWEPTGASTLAEADSVGTQQRPRRYLSFTSIPTPATPLYPLLKCLGP